MYLLHETVISHAFFSQQMQINICLLCVNSFSFNNFLYTLFFTLSPGYNILQLAKLYLKEVKRYLVLYCKKAL